MNTLNINFPSQLFGKQKVFELTPDAASGNKPVKVLVLHDSNGAIAQQDLELLQKILAAAKISSSDFSLENVNNHFSLAQLQQQFQPQFLLVFSNQKTALGKNLQLPLHEIISLKQTQILRSVTLKELQSNAEHKKQLWAKMKILFNV